MCSNNLKVNATYIFISYRLHRNKMEHGFYSYNDRMGLFEACFRLFQKEGGSIHVWDITLAHTFSNLAIEFNTAEC